MRKLLSILLVVLLVGLMSGCTSLATYGPVKEPRFHDEVYRCLKRKQSTADHFYSGNWLANYHVAKGFYRFRDVTTRSGVVVLADTKLVFLCWNRKHNCYNIIQKVSYSNISEALWLPFGLGGWVRIQQKNGVFHGYQVCKGLVVDRKKAIELQSILEKRVKAAQKTDSRRRKK